MKTIIFYLSDHGFGHAARNIPIIQHLIEDGIKVIIKTGPNQGEFIKSNIENVIVETDSMDIGLVLKPNSFEIDPDALSETLENYIQSWDGRVNKEIDYLKTVNPDLIVCDIVPWILKAAKQLQIKSCLISNFTWMEIYKEYLPVKIIREYESCYQLADSILRYDLSTKKMFTFFKEAQDVSLCARDFNPESALQIKNSYSQPLVFVSVGRSIELARVIDVSTLPYHFIVTEGINLCGNNVTYLPKEIKNTQDYILASDHVITKAGFGTVAEALLAKKKIAVIGRDHVAEDRSTINHLVNRNLALKISYEEAFDLNQILDDLNNFHPSYDKEKFTNDAAKIARQLVYQIKGHQLIQLTALGTQEEGQLVPLDTLNVPFPVKRIFYLMNVPNDKSRGNHAYYKTRQLLICLAGSVKIKCDHEVYELTEATEGLLIESHVWREAFSFSKDAIILVLSSELYNKDDYKK